MRSYEKLFEQALAEKNLQILRRTILNFNVNALHSFVLTKNIPGIEACSKANTPFIRDVFGNTPFDYARELADPRALTALCDLIIKYPPKM